MSDPKPGKQYYSTGNLAQDTLSKSYMGRLFLVAKEKTQSYPAKEHKRLEVLLSVIDFCLFFTTAFMSTWLIKLISPQTELHGDAMILLNFSIFTISAIIYRYFDLSEGRYSLGKALLITMGLWLINCLTLAVSGANVSFLCPFLFVLYSVTGIVSGYLHYKVSFPYTVKNPDSRYCLVERCIKRLFDLVVCLLGLLAISPLLLVIALVIAMEGKGQVLFGQARVGYGEKGFKMWKFRSMVVNAAEQQSELPRQTLYKKENDPRITRIGKLIRKLSIDELPQLWNVVCGEMSLVGPRPPLVKEYEQMNSYHRRKFEAMPGITGFWQITGRIKNHRAFNEVALYDVHYIENWCLMEDLKILLKTIPVVLFQKGAY